MSPEKFPIEDEDFPPSKKEDLPIETPDYEPPYDPAGSIITDVEEEEESSDDVTDDNGEILE